MNIVFMSLDTLPSTLWARDLYDQMHIRSDFRKWFPRMCQYGFIEGRDYEYMPRVRLQDEGGRTVQRYVKDYRITQQERSYWILTSRKSRSVIDEFQRYKSKLNNPKWKNPPRALCRELCAQRQSRQKTF